jgi:hypothetical protein
MMHKETSQQQVTQHAHPRHIQPGMCCSRPRGQGCYSNSNTLQQEQLGDVLSWQRAVQYLLFVAQLSQMPETLDGDSVHCS